MFRPRVLAVDDRSENLQVYREILAPLDIELVTAPSGQQALWLVLKHEFALILLDVQMPEMDGLETAAFLRRREHTRDVPIIFVTAGDFNRRLYFEGYELGAVDFIFKPLDPHVLRSKIKGFTDLDRKIHEYRAAKDQAEATSLAKTRFVATMSHELRTPLNAILGYLQLLQRSGVQLGEHQGYLDTICDNGRLLGSLIDDILDITRAESGELTVEHTQVNLPRLLDDLHALFSFQAQEKRLALTVERCGTAPLSFRSDPTRLRQILINLIGNAIKFTPDGGRVSVTAERKEGTLRFRVSDTGIGIESELQDKIFNLFFQARSSHRREFGGAGLGLDLARRLCIALGGELGLERSAPGQGSVFVVSLPLDGSESLECVGGEGVIRATPSLPHASLSGLRILVADDSEANLALMRELLTSEGADCTTVPDGMSAVRQSIDEAYDLIIIDLCMPLMDGFEATRTLRAQGFQKPILALTANALAESMEEALAAGCNAFATKPIDIPSFVRSVIALTSIPLADN